jgi:hypothetical protein
LLQNTSRIEPANGIKFYEQDILYDNYVYSGSSTISVIIDYNNPGFGIALISSTSSMLNNTNAVLLFRISNKVLDIIYKENDMQTILKSFNVNQARTATENLKLTIDKNNNSYKIKVNDQELPVFESSYGIDSYYIGYYSNKDNVIKHINIASAVPFGWIVNMENTNGGYIEFYRDAFELNYCNGIAELEQINITLNKGRYYLKYDSIDSDIAAYIMHADDKRINDDEKNILHTNGFFEVQNEDKFSLKFKGTKGRIQNIMITSSQYGDYLRTSPDCEYGKQIKNSYFKLYLYELSAFEFKGTVNFVPGTDHYSPIDYSIVENDSKTWGLYDLNIAVGIEYYYKYANGLLEIYNPNNIMVSSVPLNDNVITLFHNINGRLKNFIITTLDGDTINITLENTIKKYLPGNIKSPIIVENKYLQEPLDLSSSYRWYYKNNKPYYVFTNTEREYFEPNHTLFLSSPILNKLDTVKVYCIKHNSKFELDELLHIRNEAADDISLCADSYDILFESDIRNINKDTGEIRLDYIDEYKYIIVDYIKADSYCVNYRYELNSYEIDIAAGENVELNMYYDNIIQHINSGNIMEYISSSRYYDTKIQPSLNCYITIGGDNI